MSKLTQGTQVFFIDPSNDEVVTVECATAFNPGGSPSDQIEDTCLEGFERTYLPGLRTPGQASLTLNADPRNGSHLKLYSLSATNPPPTLKWAVGWSGSADVPTVLGSGDDAVFELPDTRSWFIFEGYVSDFPFDFQLNSVVTGDVAIQRSGGSQWVPSADAVPVGGP